MVDILAGVPSIVAALFVFALWIATLKFEQSALAVSFALVLLMLPVVVRSTEEMLKLVPDELREASYALGVPKWKTIVRIVVPTALPGMISGMLLAIARVMGETAPVLVLVGYSQSINFDIFHGNMASLPLLIYSSCPIHSPRGDAGVGRVPDADPDHRPAVRGGARSSTSCSRGTDRSGRKHPWPSGSTSKISTSTTANSMPSPMCR